MPFLKVVEINENGRKVGISEQAYNPRKHQLWTGNAEITPSKPVKKPVDLDFEPKPEVEEESETKGEESKKIKRRR